MEYLVLECHLSYAVVMDDQGRFLKVANRNYEVGQRVGRVIPMELPEKKTALRMTPVLAMAACLCLVCVGFWQMMLLSMGTVLIQINPQIRLSVNRMERVISAEALNADGAAVLFDYACFGKPVEQVTWELGGRAADMGYLTGGGEVHLQVASDDARWKSETEHRLESVQSHLDPDVTVVIEPETWTPGQTPEPESTEPIPTLPPESEPAETLPTPPMDDDDWDDDDWDDGADDDWDDDDSDDEDESDDGDDSDDEDDSDDGDDSDDEDDSDDGDDSDDVDDSDDDLDDDDD